MLNRRIARLSMSDVKVDVAIAALSDEANLPLSSVQADPADRVSLNLHDVTVRQALDAFVANSPRYRYDVIAGRLVLYPRDPKWTMQIADIHLGPVSRRRMTYILAKELGQRSSEFPKFVGTWVLGDPGDYTYQDEVTVAGSGSVIEILAQLLGKRPSTFFIINRIEKAPAASISVSSQDQLQSLKLTAAATTLRHRDQQIQLKLIGTLRYGGVAMDLTLGACGAVYKVSNEKVLSVNQDGLVTAKGNGTAQVTAELERSVAEVTIKVDLPVESGSLP